MDVIRMKISPNRPFPGNEIALRLYRSVFNQAETGLSARFSKLFSDNGWSVPWVNCVFGFHHFTPPAQERLGFPARRVIVQMGGPSGPEVKLEAGDAVLIPAGVGHKNIKSSSDYRILGSYPHGQQPDIRRGDPDEWDEVLDEIAHVRLWDKDPVTGEKEAQVRRDLGSVKLNQSNNTLSPDLLRKMEAYWRSANYL